MNLIRRSVVCLLTTALLPALPLVDAQQPKKVPRIGFLDPGTPSSSSARDFVTLILVPATLGVLPDVKLVKIER